MKILILNINRRSLLILTTLIRAFFSP